MPTYSPDEVMDALAEVAADGGGLHMWVSANGTWHVELRGIFPTFGVEGYGSGPTLGNALAALAVDRAGRGGE